MASVTILYVSISEKGPYSAAFRRKPVDFYEPTFIAGESLVTSVEKGW